MLEYLKSKQIKALETSYVPFLRQVRTATARGTFYHTRQKMEQTAADLHDEIARTDRGIYAATLLLDGATDFTRQVGLHRLLTSQANGQDTFLTGNMEGQVVETLLSDLRPQKVLSVFLALKETRKSGQRIKKIMLRYVLGSPKLDRWAVTYRRKLRDVLVHAWGERLAWKIRNTVTKRLRSAEDVKLLNAHVWKYGNARLSVDELAGFILGAEDHIRMNPHGITNSLEGYVAAKHNIRAGYMLPHEVLEGIRSKYHPSVPKERVLELTAANLTRGQRRQFQRKAESEGVEVAWDPASASIVELMLYGYERGFTEVEEHIIRKADGIRARLGLTNTEVVLDWSKSMEGAGTQKYRPIAAACAMAHCLWMENFHPYRPEGDTELASRLVEALKTGPRSVFIISDGYENAPAGRVAEVIGQARKLGIQTPIYHINPTASKEGGRTFDGAISLGVSQPEALPLAMTEALLQTDVIAGLERMIPKALEVLA